jgi:hypothetical protein
MMAMVQVRRPSAGQAYYRRKLAEGKSPKEALRCLKRRLSDAVYRCLVAISTSSRAQSGQYDAAPRPRCEFRPTLLQRPSSVRSCRVAASSGPLAGDGS